MSEILKMPDRVCALEIVRSVNRFGVTRDHLMHYWLDDGVIEVVQEFRGCELDLLKALQRGRLRPIYQEPAASALSLEEHLLRVVNASDRRIA